MSLSRTWLRHYSVDYAPPAASVPPDDERRACDAAQHKLADDAERRDLADDAADEDKQNDRYSEQ